MNREEEKIQGEIVKWFRNTYCLKFHEPREMILHIPNEGKTNGRLVAIGLLPGAADLFFTLRGKVYFCELKTATGRLSDNQRKFQALCQQVGIAYFICRNLSEFKFFINEITP